MKTALSVALYSSPHWIAFVDRLRHRVGLLLMLLLFAPVWTEAQVVDTAAVRREVDSLVQVCSTLTGQKKYDEALSVFDVAKKRAVEGFGVESAEYAGCVFNQGRVYFLMGKYAEAEPLYLESLAIREKTLDKEHPDYAAILSNMGILYTYMGKYERAELFHLEALAIREKTLDKEHPDYVTSQNNLAVFYTKIGNYEKAEPLYLEVHAIWGKTLGKEHPDYARSLNNLANLYWVLGNYEKAEPFSLESLAIRGKTLGREHPDYAWSLVNLANLYLSMGKYEKAEPLYPEALAIQENVLGKEHPDYARSLNSLANLYEAMGSYERAEPLFLEALAIREKTLGKEHSHYAESLNSLARLYWKLGSYEKAEPLYLESLAIWEKSLGKEHPYYAGGLNNLANLYEAMGSYERAEPLFLEALAIQEKSLGKEHPDYASGLNNLALLYEAMGSYEKAEPLFLEALAIREKTVDKEHPDYAGSIYNIAIINLLKQKSDIAGQFLSTYASIEKSLLWKASRYLSESELASYVQGFADWENRIYSFAQTQWGYSSLCYDNALFQNGFLLNAVSKTNRLAFADPSTTEKYYRLKSFNRSLSSEYAKPIAERKNVEELEEKANTLEKELVRTVAGFGEVLRQVSWQEVRDILLPNEASIEFVRYQYFDQKARATDSIMYAALLLLPGAPAPEFIPLFEERQIQALLPADKVIEDLSKSGQRANFIQNLYANPALYELLWAPIEKALAEKNIQTVYFSPAGILHRLNLGAIADKFRAPLANRYRLVQLGSTRELVTDRNAAKPKPVSAVVYGGVQYETDSTAIAQANRNLGAAAQDTTGGLFRYSPHNSQSSGTRGEDFNYLQGSEAEARHLHALLRQQGVSSTLRMGYSATEESFKQIGQNGPSPSLLHIGTHGFFFPDPKDTTRRRTVGIGDDAPAFKISEHPLIRSGLLLAGSRYAWEQKRPMPGMEDGILTAHEVSQMKLSNTDLVVLSACETGLGDIKGNEGVYGLQRAFRIAGAKNVLMSLWKVSDEATALLLNRFYENWLQKGLSVRTALEEAQSWMRGQELYRNPYYWAGFVLVGE